MNGGIRVVAIGVISHVASGRRAGLSAYIRITITVAVRIAVECCLYTFIDLPIAVVVNPVAQLGCTGMDRGICVIAVGVISDVASRGRAGLSRDIRIAVTIAIGIAVER